MWRPASGVRGGRLIAGAALVMAVSAAACASDDAAPATADSTASASPVSTSSTSTSLNSVAPTTLVPEVVDPLDWLIIDEPTCALRPGEASVSEEEFPFEVPALADETVLTDAIRSERAGVSLLDRDGAELMVLRDGWSQRYIGSPDLLAAQRGGEWLYVWERCFSDVVAGNGSILAGDHLVVRIENPRGLVILDLRNGEPVGAIAAEVSPVGPDPSDPGKVLAFVTQWAKRSGQAVPLTLHRLDLAQLTLGPAVLTIDAHTCCAWVDSMIVGNDLLIERNDVDAESSADLFLHSLDDGSVLAERTSPSQDRESRTTGVSESGGWVWAGYGDRLLRLDPTTLEPDGEIALENLRQIASVGAEVWYTTVDPDDGHATIGVVDPASMTTATVATVALYEWSGRGGTYTWTPTIRPVAGGALVYDDRAGGDFFLAAPSSD